ncbi:MAG: NAD(P)-dependent dehydrogenase (short-subunit alcohol dehydrogenase family) [Hyphomicrobiaceae bacterium]|jgi:NAD(P)-dependent dehydrogenase (short-subunit alcohol dehydrogenase family)
MDFKLNSFPPSYRALILGSSGAIGTALKTALENRPGCQSVMALHRRSHPPLDFNHEPSIEAAALSVAAQGPFNLIVNAAGFLHDKRFRPEKKLDQLSYDQLAATFAVNTFGPALVFRHFSKLLDRDFGMMAHLSAKVGSIEDNHLGGWYSYRASKAALNMIIKTASIELTRNQRNSVIVAVHPGTVTSNLSRPFKGETLGREAKTAAQEILALLERLTPADSGRFFAYNGDEIEW